jgi:hypothetical protein
VRQVPNTINAEKMDGEICSRSTSGTSADGAATSGRTVLRHTAAGAPKAWAAAAEPSHLPFLEYEE